MIGVSNTGSHQLILKILGFNWWEIALANAGAFLYYLI
jgi:hypothetical protein